MDALNNVSISVDADPTVAPSYPTSCDNQAFLDYFRYCRSTGRYDRTCVNDGFRSVLPNQRLCSANHDAEYEFFISSWREWRDYNHCAGDDSYSTLDFCPPYPTTPPVPANKGWVILLEAEEFEITESLALDDRYPFILCSNVIDVDSGEYLPVTIKPASDLDTTTPPLLMRRSHLGLAKVDFVSGDWVSDQPLIQFEGYSNCFGGNDCRFKKSEIKARDVEFEKSSALTDASVILRTVDADLTVDGAVFKNASSKGVSYRNTDSTANFTNTGFVSRGNSLAIEGGPSSVINLRAGVWGIGLEEDGRAPRFYHGLPAFLFFQTFNPEDPPCIAGDWSLGFQFDTSMYFYYVNAVINWGAVSGEKISDISRFPDLIISDNNCGPDLVAVYSGFGEPENETTTVSTESEYTTNDGVSDSDDESTTLVTTSISTTEDDFAEFGTDEPTNESLPTVVSFGLPTVATLSEGETSFSPVPTTPTGYMSEGYMSEGYTSTMMTTIKDNTGLNSDEIALILGVTVVVGVTVAVVIPTTLGILYWYNYVRQAAINAGDTESPKGVSSPNFGSNENMLELNTMYKNIVTD
ncbi:hypothetical protein [Endozoicomonas arenosclerae]|uniref:hypothetical protein n=1 Tax=Endozoicomonas arenosclerae TaxID=1633495 RepID=UPI0007805C79|nr:hypothetical protein [Endozoicomonas arenosclerae]